MDKATRRREKLPSRLKRSEPVTRTTTTAKDEPTAEAARAALFARLRKQRPMIAAPSTRAELYGDE